VDTLESKWVKKVGAAFRSKPRIGGKKGIVWLDRTDIENDFQKLILTPGINICLDGPSGTGKTSLALTSLDKLGIEYEQVQVTQNMDWKGFCRRLIEIAPNREASISAEILGSLEGVLPSGSIKLSLGSKGKPSEQYELWDTVLSNCDEADICAALSKKDAIVVIDDFEKAQDELVTRIADMCKLLTQSFETEVGKILVIGTGDIFSRIYGGDPALEERLQQFSLGTLPSPEWSWKYLQLGFEALGLYHPANSRFSSPQDNLNCMNEVYKAANGLFKGLTALGRQICFSQGLNAKGISHKTVLEEARKIPPQNYKRFRRKFPMIFKCIEANPVVRGVLQYLYDSNIGQIHNWNDISFDLNKKYDMFQIDNAISELVEVGFLVRTGKEGETLFVHEPILAHIFGVVISYPNEFEIPLEFSTVFGQYKLPFLSRNDSKAS